jgi:hypothetical protein
MTSASAPGGGDGDKNRKNKRRKRKSHKHKNSKPKSLYDYESRPVHPNILSMDISNIHFVWFADDEVAKYQGTDEKRAKATFENLIIDSLAKSTESFGRVPQWWIGKELKKEDRRGEEKKKEEEKKG